MRKTAIALAMIISGALTACGPETAAGDAAVETTMEQSEKGSYEEQETSAAEIVETAQSAEEESQEVKENAHKAENAKESGYEDNFAVDTSAAAEFADKIKAAAAARDIEALADLTSFPVYVGIEKGGVETREEFIALGAERVFTPELVSAIEGADLSKLSPSMAGFTISKDGTPNIIFGVVEGNLAISGINY